MLPRKGKKMANSEPLDNITGIASPSSQSEILEPLSLTSQSTNLSPPEIDEISGQIMQVYNPVYKYEMHSEVMKFMGKRHRIASCLTYLKASEVQIKQHLESETVFYGGLMVCGLVWVCPVCAAKIQKTRSEEVKTAIAKHDGSVLMATFTAPHTRVDSLSDLLDKMLSAYRYFTGSKAHKRLSDKYGLVGSIRALEVTYNFENGWHVHFHVLLFMTKDIDMAILSDEMFDLWCRSALKKGLNKPSKKAFELQDASLVSSYLSKMGTEYQWGPAEELVKAHSKRGQSKSYSPFDFIRSYMETEDPIYAVLFRDYEKAFKGRNMLVWSRGLKKHFGIVQRSDEAIAESIGEPFKLLASISGDQWKKLRKFCRDGAWRGQLLEVVKEHGYDGLANYYEAIVGEPFIIDQNTVLAHEWSQ